MLRQVTSLQHPLVKHLVKLRQHRDYRYDHLSVVIEGIKPINEIGQKLSVKTIIATDEALLPKFIKATNTFLVTEDVMHKISGMQTPEGLIAEITMPQRASLKGLRYLIALDGINDPGNLGTLLRTALALGWEGAFILNESCDPFNEKSLRAARGATFRLPLAWGSWEELKELINANKLKPVVADLHGTLLSETKINTGILLVLGNEAQGISKEAKELCQAITIPMPGEMESLNVAIAGGIMMYALRVKDTL